MILKKKLDSKIISLPRGGYIIDTEIGYIQFGSPPETIKDTMNFPKGVPQIFVLPSEFFNWIKGISVAEVEFPIYYNFFLKNRKTLIICNGEQIINFKNVLAEAVFGPEVLELESEFLSVNKSNYIPSLKSEMDYFRRNLKLDDLVDFGIFKNNSYNINNDIKIRFDESGNFIVALKDGKEINVPGKIEYVPTYDIGKRLSEPYEPPLFGITCLGPSHGFDPSDNTSGFILWLNHRGIMVDPPVNSTEWLQDSNVNPKFIDSIILTHCHADHDAGTFQKILEEGKVNVYSTRTIMNSFLRKYSALTFVSDDFLMRLFTFFPIKIGNPVFIHGAKFKFFYSLHSIPTIGFKMDFQRKSFVYSSDHNNDPKLHKKLLKTGVIDKKRYKELKNFSWDADVIYHESGFPPLHTPITILDKLDPDIKKKTVVYHISKKDFKNNTDNTELTLAKFGIEHTLNIGVKYPEFEKPYQILGLLNYLDFFEDMPVSKGMEFLNIIEEKKFKKGDVIIKKGAVGDMFYIIKSGNIIVTGGDFHKRKIYGACDYFGEAALVTDKKRAADVIAETDVVVYTITKDKFLYFISGTEFEKTLIRLAKTRDSESWNVLSNSKIFGILTSTQKTILESMIYKIERPEPGVLIREGEYINEIFIIRKGEVEVFKNNKEIAILKRGDFIGAMVKVLRNEPTLYTFKNFGPVSMYAIGRDDVVKFLDKNPGLIMKLTYDF